MQNKVDNSNYYVYVHKKKNSDIIFYVGKGKLNRHKSLSGRNLHWKNTAKKNGWYSVIVKNNLVEEEALELEEFMIETIGLENLCNKNYFNGGKSGFLHTIESKEKMSIAKKGKPSWNKGKTCIETSIRMQGQNNPMYGKTNNHTEEVRQKLREKNGTIVCDLQTGIFFNSITEAGERLNIGRKTIRLRNRIHICSTPPLLVNGTP
jgi:hypothetical protein